MNVWLLLTTGCFILFVPITSSKKSSPKADYQELTTEDTPSTTSSINSNDSLLENDDDVEVTSAYQQKATSTSKSNESTSKIPLIIPAQVTSRSGTPSSARSNGKSVGSKKSVEKLTDDDDNEILRTSSDGNKATGSNDSNTRSERSSGSIVKYDTPPETSNTSLESSRKSMINHSKTDDKRMGSQETVSQHLQQVVKSSRTSHNSKSDTETGWTQFLRSPGSTIEELKGRSSESESSDDTEKPLLKSSRNSSNHSEKSTVMRSRRQSRRNSKKSSSADESKSEVSRYTVSPKASKAGTSNTIDSTSTEKAKKSGKSKSPKKSESYTKSGNTKATDDSDDAKTTSNSKATSYRSGKTGSALASNADKKTTRKEEKKNEKKLKKLVEDLGLDSDDTSTVNPYNDNPGVTQRPILQGRTISRTNLLTIYVVVCCLLLILLCQLLRLKRIKK